MKFLERIILVVVFLTDQEAYPENPFYRTPRYSGGDPNLGNTAGMF